MVVCDNGAYALFGPIGFNQEPPCEFCRVPEPVPTVSQWGMLLLALLLTGSGLWFIRRHRKRHV
jgi:hypothetical protein